MALERLLTAIKLKRNSALPSASHPMRSDNTSSSGIELSESQQKYIAQIQKENSLPLIIGEFNAWVERAFSECSCLVSQDKDAPVIACGLCDIRRFRCILESDNLIPHRKPLDECPTDLSYVLLAIEKDQSGNTVDFVLIPHEAEEDLRMNRDDYRWTLRLMWASEEFKKRRAEIEQSNKPDS